MLLLHCPVTKAPANWGTPPLSFPRLVLTVLLSLDFFPDCALLFFVTLLFSDEHWANMEILLPGEASFDMFRGIEEGACHPDLAICYCRQTKTSYSFISHWIKPPNWSSSSLLGTHVNQCHPCWVACVPPDGDGNFGDASAVAGSFPVLWWDLSFCCGNNQHSKTSAVTSSPSHKHPSRSPVACSWGITVTKAWAVALWRLWSSFVFSGILGTSWKISKCLKTWKWAL